MKSTFKPLMQNAELRMENNSQFSILNSQFIIVLALLFFAATSAFATQARIEGMGKRPAFFLDDMTMFDNPANVTFYSSALFGELGFYRSNTLGPNDVGITRDPLTPWFGALFQFGLSDKGLRDPEITIGGFFGRENYDLTRFVPRKVIVFGDTVPIPQSITNFDGFLAATMIDGSAVGVHIYVGVQDGKQDGLADGNDKIEADAHVSILSMDYGANVLISNRSSIEATLGVARVQYGPSRKTFLDPGLFSFYSQGRLFLEMDYWSGQLVSGYKLAAMEVPGWKENLYDVNVGLNAIVPRGLFWFGFDAVHVKQYVDAWEVMEEKDEAGDVTDSYLVYREPSSPRVKLPQDRTDKIGGVISFGVERNAFGNAITIRAGGQKSFIYQTCTTTSAKEGRIVPLCEFDSKDGNGRGNFWSTNPYGDGSLDDHIGVGFGLNIENKLKIDATVSEDVFLRNPLNFKAAEGHIISRVSAVYSF